MYFITGHDKLLFTSIPSQIDGHCYALVVRLKPVHGHDDPRPVLSCNHAPLYNHLKCVLAILVVHCRVCTQAHM